MISLFEYCLVNKGLCTYWKFVIWVFLVGDLQQVFECPDRFLYMSIFLHVVGDTKLMIVWFVFSIPTIWLSEVLLCQCLSPNCAILLKYSITSTQLLNIYRLERKFNVSLHSSQVAHQARAYPSFSSIKQLGVVLLHSGWDSSPS